MRKHGAAHFEMIVLCYGPAHMMPDIQRRMIKRLGTHVSEGGCNTNWGGGYVTDPVARARLKVATTEANRRMTETPEWKEAHRAGNCRKTEDPSFRAGMAEGARRRSENPAWRANVIEAAHRRAEDPAWRAAVAEGSRRMAQDPSWRRLQVDRLAQLRTTEKWRASQAKKKRPISINGQQFASASDAAAALNIPRDTIVARLRRRTPGYVYLERQS
jgi:hypothetical protein